MIRMLLTCLIMLAVCAGCGEKGARLPPSARSHQEQAYIDQGNARADQGDLAGAIADYTQAITVDPQYASAYYNRGGVRATAGEKAEAMADYTKPLLLILSMPARTTIEGASARLQGRRPEPWQIFGQPQTCISTRARPLITRMHCTVSTRCSDNPSMGPLLSSSVAPH